MLCLKHSGSEIVAQGPILKAADFAATLEAQDILAHARAEAERIRTEAQREYEQQKERGHREGVEQGKAEMAERVVAAMGQSNVYFSKLEEALVDVVIKSTRRIIGEFDARERVVRIVREALDLLRQQSQVRLKVSPAQREWLQTRVQELLAAFPRIQFLDVQSDARLPDDGCILETELGVIDATVETQLRAIEKALIQAIK
jgi:type III secretion protein L